MRIEALTVALRPRSPWEAVELGSALVRRHAAAIWRPWLLLTVPALVLLNLLAWALDAIWLASVLMWWLKPVFDRVPLYVLSRAVFGDVPGTRQTLRAQLHWSWRWMPAYLSWRRLSPVRPLYLPVDLLEGAAGAEARHRRRVLGSSAYSVGAMLTLVCINFEIALVLGMGALVFVFIPNEYLVDSARALWQELGRGPMWLQFTSNAMIWLATTLVEPFFVGAGFGLYLNRRTQIEAWDIELVLRRLRARLLAIAAPMAALVLGVGMLLMPMHGHAQGASADASEGSGQTRPEQEQARQARAIRGRVAARQAALHAGAQAGSHDADPGSRLDQIFPSLADDRSLRKAVARGYADPALNPKRKVTRWRPRDAKPEARDAPPAWLADIARALAVAGEYGLWLVFGGLALALALTLPRWWPWLRNGAATLRSQPAPSRQEPLPTPDPLPDDIPTTVRRLWHDGRHREALALLYRASVDSMAQRTNATLVPGATEAQCLRASRQLPLAEDRDLFARMVRTWQYAAYAGRWPLADEFDGLVLALTQRFGWAR